LGWDYLPPPEKPPLREELDVVDRPKPPDELGLLAVVGVDGRLEDVVEELPNERCD
jgi:hypothetical protein